MNISSITQSNSIFKNAHITNQNNVKQNTALKQPVKKDTVSISAKGKSANVIQNLQKQKQALMQRKSEIRAKAMQDGQNSQDINTLLETYDLQIENIDAQISRIQSEEAQEATKPKQSKEPKTKQEAEKQNIANLTNLSVQAEQTDTIYTVKEGIDRKAETLKSEIELDKMHDAGKNVIEKKQKSVTELEQKSDNLMKDVQQKLEEIQQYTNKETKKDEKEKTQQQ